MSFPAFLNRPLSLLALLASTHLATADLITVSFTGSVTELDEGGGVTLGSEFSLGESVSGFITFDDSISSTGGSNQGTFPDAIKVLEVDIGDYHVSLGERSPTGHILESNNDNQNGPFRGDHLRTRTLGFRGDPVGIAQPATLSFGMSDAENLVFANNAATQSLTPTYDFAEFEVGSLDLQFNIVGDNIGQTLSGSLRTSIANFTVVDTPPNTRALFDVLEVETSEYELDGDNLATIASIQGAAPFGAIEADFTALGDEAFEMHLQAPVGKAIEIQVPTGFTPQAVFFLIQSEGLGGASSQSVPLAVEIETAGGAPLPAPEVGELLFYGTPATGMEAAVAFLSLVPGETYRIRSITATGIIPASFDGTIDGLITNTILQGRANIPSSTGAPDPGQWIRLVDLTELTPEVEIIAPDYRAAVIGDTIHLPMEVVLNPNSDIYDWNLAILPGPGLTVSNPTVLETQAASVNDTPAGVRELSGSELTELTTSPTGGIVSSVSLSDVFTTSLGATGAPHKILRFTLSGPTPEVDGRAVWSVGFTDGLVGSGVPINNQLTTDEEFTFKPFTENLVFEVYDTIPTTIRKEGANLVLEWAGRGEGEGAQWDVYSFTDFHPESVELWAEGVPSGELSTSLTFPQPADPRRFFTIVPAPFEGGGFPGPGGDD